VAVLAGLTHALDLADAAADLGEPVPLVAGHHDAVAERFDLSWLMAQSAPEPTDTYWAHAAKAALRDELTEQGVLLTRAAVTGVEPSSTGVRMIVDELRTQLTVDIPMLVVAVRVLRRAAAGER
jgi:NAD-specific glutamate dehydrogenase